VLTSARNILKEAQEALNSGNYTKAYGLFIQAKQRADEIKNQYETTKPKLDEAKSTITSYKSQGVILTPAENLLAEAETAFNSGNYTKAYNYANQAIQKAEEIKAEYDRAKPELKRAKSTISTYKSQGIILAPAENLLNEAQNAFDSGDYVKAHDYSEQAIQKAEEIKNQYYRAKEAISKAEGFLSPIGDAKKAFEKGDYLKAYQLAVEAGRKRDLYQKLFALGVIISAALIGGSSYRVHRKRERERKLREINSIIERAEKAPVLEKIRLLKEAEKLAGPVGPEALGRVRKLLSPAMNEARETYNRIIREFDSALEGLDVKTAEAKLSEAKPYAEILGRKDFKRKGERLERLKKELKDLQRTERLVKRGNLKEAAPTLTQLSSSPFEGVRKKARALLGEVEGWLSKVIAKGDSLFSSGDYAGAIKAYESALPIAEALGKGDMVRSKIESSRRTLDELRKRKRLEELLKEINAALSRRDYPSLGNLLQEVGKIARETRETRKVKALREELSTRLDNLLSKGEELELSGDYGGALAAYTEALSLAEALGRKTDDIEAAVSRIEEGQKKALLKKSVRLDVPTEMAHRAETEVSILVTNRFSSDLTLTADLSENRDYFELSEEKVEFPHVKPGKTIGESVTVKPKFIGDFDFTVKIDSNFGSLTSRTPVKVVKTMRAVTGATPAPVTSTPVLNPVEALQELYTDFQYIGEGGFARVYKAKRKDGKIVALKLPKTLDPAVGRAFVREITNWLHLKHPNIVELHDVNVIPVPYLEMEYCESSLARLGKPLPVEEASLIVFNIAEGLKYAHSKGIIHRDLKPSNVLLKNGLPKISDWGLSKVLEESMSATTTASFTPYYAAPEQIDRKFGRTDERTDIYQLGVLFYELVTGRLPFEGSLSQVMMGIIRDKPVPPGQLNPEARKVEPIIMKMLAKKKEDRYASVVELQRDLAGVLNMTYSENLKKSKTIGDLRRAVYYLTELLLINMKTNNVSEAYKYAGDLAYYTSGELRDEVKKLAEQVKLRLEESLDIPPELVEKAEIIAHKIRLGFEGS
ncbi:protein kinase, partial [Thermococcus sp.]|uniref:serine/threonine-protein kinase n=1 Tax=Thermococcus sp. TaxID=35749 RepID=UPI00261F2E09